MGDFNSKEYSYADIKVSFLGMRLTGLRGLIYKKKQEKQHVFGEGSDPKAIQRGNKTYDGQLMLLKSDFDTLNDAAEAAGYEDIMDVPNDQCTITCVYENNGIVRTVTLIGVDITDDEDGMKSGDLFKEVTLPFLYLRRKKS